MNKFNLMAGAATIMMLSAVYPASAADINSNANAKGIINFDALDTDNNGVISDSEFNANSSFVKGSKFSEVDRNDDGTIDDKELSIWARVHGKGDAVGTVTKSNVNSTTGVVNSFGVHNTVRHVDSNTNIKVNGNANTNTNVNKGTGINTGVGLGLGVGVNGNVSDEDKENNSNNNR